MSPNLSIFVFLKSCDDEVLYLEGGAHCGTSGKQSLHDMQALHVASGRGPRISGVVLVGGRHKPIAVI